VWKRAGLICGASWEDRATPSTGTTVYPSGSIQNDGTYNTGSLGNPLWWLYRESATDDQLKSLVKPQGVPNVNGCYHVSVTTNGVTSDVVIDDWIPCTLSDGTPLPAFGFKGSSQNLWSLLLTKAYAKQRGSFMMGMSAEHPVTDAEEKILSDLTQGAVLTASEREALMPIVKLGAGFIDSVLGEGTSADEQAGITQELGALLSQVQAQSNAVPETTLSELNAFPFFRFLIDNWADAAPDDQSAEAEFWFEGSRPDDLIVEIKDKNQTVVFSKAFNDMSLPNVQFNIKGQGQPYVLSFLSSADPDHIPELDVDVKCDNESLSISQCDM